MQHRPAAVRGVPVEEPTTPSSWPPARRRSSCTECGADQHDLAEHFGGTTAHDDPGKLAEWAWEAGPGGAPVIADCDWFAGRVESRFDAGDHVAFVLAPFAGECAGTGQLGFQDARDIEAGEPA